MSENHRYEMRAEEIAEWIRNNHTEGYIIIDDSCWPGYETETIQPHWIQTDSRKGLEEKHIEEAVAKMTVPVK